MSRENVEQVRMLFEHWARGDFFVTDEAFDPQVELVRIGAEGTGLTGRRRGLAEVRAALREYLGAFDGYRVQGEQFIDLDDERVFVLSRERAAGRASSAPIEHETAYVFTLRDSRVVRWQVYWDRQAARKASGLEG